MRAIRVQRHGGPEVLTVEELPMPVPGPGEALIRIEAAGVNWVDASHRTGSYPMPTPFTPGIEGAGTVVALGTGAVDLRVGERVGFPGLVRPGAYAEYLAAPADRMVPLPQGVGAGQAAVALAQGVTAHVLTEDVHPVRPGDWVLVHAAAGGTGLLLVQCAARRGARVIGVVSSHARMGPVREAGAEAVLLSSDGDLAARVRSLAGGEGVHVAYDGTGRDTFNSSLEALRTRGTLVLYGLTSGPVPPFNVGLLLLKGSLFLTFPTVQHYLGTRAALLERCATVLEWVATGELRPRVAATLPLAEAVEAHRLLHSRERSGKILLVP